MWNGLISHDTGCNIDPSQPSDKELNGRFNFSVIEAATQIIRLPRKCIKLYFRPVTGQTKVPRTRQEFLRIRCKRPSFQHRYVTETSNLQVKVASRGTRIFAQLPCPWYQAAVQSVPFPKPTRFSLLPLGMPAADFPPRALIQTHGTVFSVLEDAW